MAVKKEKIVINNDKKPEIKKADNKSFDFAFRKENYILMIAGVVLLILGYILLSGGGSDDPTKFSEDLFNTRRLVVAPLVILCGFIVEIWAIMKRPKE